MDWHLTLKHTPLQALKKLLRLHDIKATDNPPHLDCTSCSLGKATLKSFSRSERVVTRLGDTICADFWGPVSHSSTDGNPYLLVMIDYLSNHVWVYPLASKTGTDQLVGHSHADFQRDRTPCIELQMRFGLGVSHYGSRSIPQDERHPHRTRID